MARVDIAGYLLAASFHLAFLVPAGRRPVDDDGLDASFCPRAGALSRFLWCFVALCWTLVERCTSGYWILDGPKQGSPVAPSLVPRFPGHRHLRDCHARGPREPALVHPLELLAMHFPQALSASIHYKQAPHVARGSCICSDRPIAACPPAHLPARPAALLPSMLWWPASDPVRPMPVLPTQHARGTYLALYYRASLVLPQGPDSPSPVQSSPVPVPAAGPELPSLPSQPASEAWPRDINPTASKHPPLSLLLINPGAWCLVLGAWCLVLGAWPLVLSVRASSTSLLSAAPVPRSTPPVLSGHRHRPASQHPESPSIHKIPTDRPSVCLPTVCPSAQLL